ncbi:MAG: hypothetical protein JNN11_03490 [Candidatus Doudnabacteria bacterium]|nr:hypothetical protein [Candidatus Doudnabacteria bacterium]
MEKVGKIVIAFIITVAVVLVGFLWRSKEPSEKLPVPLAEQAMPGGVEKANAEIAPPVTSQVLKGVVSGAKKLNYGEAIKKYPFRIQFANCNGSPGSLSLKRNTALMLDNRDSIAHAVKVAGQTYVIKGYDYALAYIGQEGAYNLTCDGGGAASINIEK